MKRFLSYKHHSLNPLHHYQMELILLFVAGFFLFFPFYLLMKEFNLNLQKWQWAFFIPWMVFYVLYSLETRSKIPPVEQKNPLKRPIVHWLLLGLSVVALQIQPTDLRELQSVNLSFIILSLFLADSYWDFKKLKL